jgi:ABC-type transport system involved in multi-copper enzyme maturation permease subunit
LPAKLLPFHYYQPTAILQGHYNWWNALGLLVASFIVLGITFVTFNRRDLS